MNVYALKIMIVCSSMPASSPFSTPVRRALSDAESALGEIYGDRLKKLIVYGSQARGEAHPDSDVDLMIVLGGRVYPDEEAQRTSQLVIRLASEYGVALSPLHLSEENFERDRPLPRAARREGVVL
ncbi:hypothetical protein GGP80_003012 [Salinibacter ruber]|uniref:Nucleotidyltransferase domain, putative n=2 Tax=Salinibacter ruber TaxID=146919 RepID=Q2S648_SALRD|nr:nucleotidyltransferase domain-containing protein [Salinibacter ruber]ABC45738.1 Nucleotidyltransferase domain, putative [Salinibacter ruber DSM 13855]MCS3856258.1 hypothetical protein [Salinibacter ruber]MCS3937004.1 hypothetical protein [Salinibacter ruber]MCS4044365.1 hypothetical protein [Salinibacter ruber]MCS4048168.1 hypothetical protein [Salinibacter ruber]